MTCIYDGWIWAWGFGVGVIIGAIISYHIWKRSFKKATEAWVDDHYKKMREVIEDAKDK